MLTDDLVDPDAEHVLVECLNAIAARLSAIEKRLDALAPPPLAPASPAKRKASVQDVAWKPGRVAKEQAGRALKRLIHNVGASEAARLLGVETTTLAQWMDGDYVPLDHLDNVRAHLLRIETAAARRGTDDDPVAAPFDHAGDVRPRLDELAEARP